MSFFCNSLKHCTSCRFKLLNVPSSVFHLQTVTFSSKTHSFTLLSDVEELLESGDMKHRKHPGVRKAPPIQLPKVLVNSVDKLLLDENEKNLQKEADKLRSYLIQRRLPLEQEEVNVKIRKKLSLNDGESLDGLAEVLTKEQMNALRRQVKAEASRWKPLEYNYNQCLAYLVSRLDSNYASISRVFSEIESQIPDFQPKTFFDFGSGLGTAAWVAHSLWKDSIEEYFCVDTSPDMNDIAQKLLTDAETEKLLVNSKSLHFRQFLPASNKVKYDIVVSAFSMLDLSNFEDRIRVVDTLWRKTNDLLVIIEYGNFAGYFSVMDARDYILQLENQTHQNEANVSTGTHIVSPCPHEQNCPMLEGGTKISCGVHVAYENLFPRHRQVVRKDWISYVVLRKGKRPEDSVVWPRIVKPVLKRSKHVYCRACCADGNINEVVVTKKRHGRHAYRCARSSTLGDLLPVNIEAVPATEETKENVHHKEEFREAE